MPSYSLHGAGVVSFEQDQSGVSMQKFGVVSFERVEPQYNIQKIGIVKFTVTTHSVFSIDAVTFLREVAV